MKQILLSQGKVAIVDDIDFDSINKFKWHTSRYELIWYAVRTDSKNFKIYMHRQILCAEKHQQIDHHNGNGLDNRRENLRFCTGTQNQSNRGKQKNNKNKFKCVYWRRDKSKYQTVIQINGRRIHLGYFNDEVEAAKVYDEAAKKHFGEFARLNFHSASIRDTAVAI